MRLQQASALKHPHALRRLSVPPFIALLLRAGGPTAVARFVVAIVVDAVQRMIGRWAPAHIGQKVFVGAAPPVAYRDTASAVITVALVGLGVAAFQHAAPRPKLGGPASSARFAVRGQHLAEAVFVVAAAALRESSPQASAGNDTLSAAVAPTQPMGAGVVSPRASHDRQPAVALSCCQNDWRGHPSIITEAYVALA
jgi:hypothetical protein